MHACMHVTAWDSLITQVFCTTETFYVTVNTVHAYRGYGIITQKKNKC